MDAGHSPILPTSLAEGEVRVRWLSLAGVPTDAVGALSPSLDDAERQQAARFRFDRDRLSYTSAHALTRAMLAPLVGMVPCSLRFVAGAHGKPALVPEQNPGRLSFNLSHTGGMVAVAVTRGAELGIDVEARDRTALTLDVAESHFSPAEIAALRAMPPAALPDALAALWTLKEAYVKALGSGLSHPLSAFSIQLEPLGISFADAGVGDPERWTLKRLAPDAAHVLALAVERPEHLTRIDVASVKLGPKGIELAAGPIGA